MLAFHVYSNKPMTSLSPQAQRALHKLQQARGNALYVTANFGAPEDREALSELEVAGLVDLRTVTTGAIMRKQAKLTATGLTMTVSTPRSSQ